jgi:GntR family histidine utilization transcriptional repressor
MTGGPSRLRRRKAADETPFYLAIKTDIASAIASGRLKPGDRVASEHELVRRYAVSRMTANRALRELAQEGLVIRLRGVGSFVAEAPVMTDILVLRHVAEEIKQRGRAYGMRLVEKGELRASAEVAAGLGLALSAPVFHALLIHTQDGTPVQVEDRYVNPAAAPAFLTIDLASVYPGSYLDQIAPADDVEHVVEAVLAERRERDLLRISAGEPCLRLIRRTWSTGTPVSLIWFTYPGRFYRLKARFPVTRSETAPAGSSGDY